eukprot:8381728-Pyramimonas_sp.AAC.1
MAPTCIVWARGCQQLAPGNRLVGLREGASQGPRDHTQAKVRDRGRYDANAPKVRGPRVWAPTRVTERKRWLLK